MPRKHLVSGALIALISFLALSMAIAMTPAQQSAITSDQALFATLDFKNTQDAANRALDADQSTQIAQLWLTVDSQHIATLVATFTSTGIPTSTRTRTNTPGVLASPTQEILTTPFSATPTFVSQTNTFTPTRTITPIPLVTNTSTPTPTPLPAMVCGTNVGTVPRNVRLEPNTTSEIVAVIPVGGTVCLDIQQRVNAENYVWIRLWSDQDANEPGHQGWISVERISPYALYIDW